MSRSHRKTPIIGVTKAPSDKSFKTSEHRRARRALNQIDLTADMRLMKSNSSTHGAPTRTASILSTRKNAPS